MPRATVRIDQIPRTAKHIGQIERGGNYAVIVDLYVFGKYLYARHVTPDHPAVYERTISIDSSVHYLWCIWETISMMRRNESLVTLSGMFDPTPMP